MLEPHTRAEAWLVPFEDVLTPDSDPPIPEPPLPGVVLRDVFARGASGRTVLRAPLVRAGDVGPHEKTVFGSNRTSPAKLSQPEVKFGSVRSGGADHATWPADPAGVGDGRSGGATARGRVIDLTAPVPGATLPPPVRGGERPVLPDPSGVAGFDPGATTAAGASARRTTRPADARWADDAFDPVAADPWSGAVPPPGPAAVPDTGLPPGRAAAADTGLPPISWEPIPPARPATVVRRCPTCDARVRVPVDAERCGAGHRLSPAHAKRRWRFPGRRSASRS